MKKIFSLFCFFSIVFFTLGKSQVTVVSATLTPFNVTPVSICEVTLLNSQGETDVMLDAAIYNSSSEALLQVTTAKFHLQSGMNIISSQMFALSSTVYSATPQGNFLQSQKQLPSGMFKHCVRVINLGGETEDEWCDDMDAETNSFLNLVSPFDMDTIDTKTPLLMWTHSEPFNLLSPGESFRLVLVKLNAGQDPESAVMANTPYFLLNNVLRHDVQYSFDAPVLVEGENYAWQVQKLAPGGTVINKTEAWQFNVRKIIPVKENKYSVLKTTPDAGYYYAYNNKIFFRFEEAYSGSTVVCKIFDEQHKEINPQPLNEHSEETNQSAVSAKSSGYNRYEIDLDDLHLKTGYYFLEVQNEKNEKFTLKFYVE